MVHVVPISSDAFAPFGDVLGPSPAGDRASVVEHWTAAARTHYGGAVKPLSLSLPAKPPELAFIEAHPDATIKEVIADHDGNSKVAHIRFSIGDSESQWEVFDWLDNT